MYGCLQQRDAAEMQAELEHWAAEAAAKDEEVLTSPLRCLAPYCPGSEIKLGICVCVCDVGA